MTFIHIMELNPVMASSVNSSMLIVFLPKNPSALRGIFIYTDKNVNVR